MKKDRNSFFSNAQMTQSSYMPNQMMPMQQGMPYNQGYAPYQASQASQSFYAGPLPTSNTYPNNTYQESNYGELDNRLAKIELQINRLDSRVTRLENNANINTLSDDQNYSSSMYMV